MVISQDINSSTQKATNYLAANLKYLRKSKGWSQSEMAAKVDLNRGNIASYERGCAEPNICNLLKMSKLFDVPIRMVIYSDLRKEDSQLKAHGAKHEEDILYPDPSNHMSRTQELADLMEASRRLFDYHSERLTEDGTDVDILAAQYRQLYDLSQRLLEENKLILSHLDCQCG